MKRYKSKQELDRLNADEDKAREILRIQCQVLAQDSLDDADYYARLKQSVESTQAALDACTSKSPCRVPRCLACSSRLQRDVRAYVSKRIATAVYFRSRYYMPVTFTSPEWILSYAEFPTTPAQFASSLVQHLRWYGTFTGGWFALDITPNRSPKSEHSRLRRWNVHIHGVIVSDSRAYALSLLRGFCREQSVDVHVEKKYLSPPDTKKLRRVVTEEQIRYWIRYCDRRNTQRVGDVTANVMTQAIMQGGERHFAFGELANTDAGRVFGARIKELSDQFRQVQQHLTGHDRELADNLLAMLGAYSGLYEATLEDLQRADESPVSATQYIGEQRKEIVRTLYRLAVNVILDAESPLFRALPDTNPIVRHLRAGALIYSVRQSERFLQPSPAIVEKLRKLCPYWPSLLSRELQGELDTSSWLRFFCRHFVKVHLEGLLDPTRIGQYLRNRKLEQVSTTAQMIEYLLSDDDD